MAWRATVTRAGWITWSIKVQHRYHSDSFGDYWHTEQWEHGGPYAYGTRRHALAKAARIVRRRERGDAWKAEAKRRALTVGGPISAGRPYVIGGGVQITWRNAPTPPSGPGGGSRARTTPNPHVDRHVAFPEDD